MEKIAGNITGQVNQQVQQAIKIQIADHVLITANEMYQPRHVFYHRMTKNVPPNDKRLPLIPLYN